MVAETAHTTKTQGQTIEIDITILAGGEIGQNVADEMMRLIGLMWRE